MLVTCSSCQSKIRVPDSAAGKKGKCPKCGTVIAIPALDAPAEEEVTAEQPAGSPFDFGADEPPPPKKGSRKTDDALEAGTPQRRSKGAADDEDAETVGEEEGEDRPKRFKKSQESTGLSMTSMILGIVSVVLGCFSFVPFCCFVSPISFLCGVGAIITGFLGMNKGGKTMAIVGLCLGGFSVLLVIVAVILGFFLGFANAIFGGAVKVG